MVVDARRRDVGVPEPLLHLGDVGMVIQCVGHRGRSQRVGTDLEPEPRGVDPHQLVDAVRGDRALEQAGAVVPDRPEQRAGLVDAVAGRLEVVVDQRVDPRMQRHITRLAALAGDFQVRHALARMPGVADPKLAQLLTPQGVKQQRRQDGAVALALHRVRLGGRQQLAGLVVAECRRLAFAALGPRPLHAFHRIVGDGVAVAQVLEQRGERGQPMPDRAAAEAALHQRVAPGDDMGACHRAELLRLGDADEAHEVADGVLVGAPGARVAEVGEPLHLGRHVGQPVELDRGQQPGAGQDLGRELVGGRAGGRVGNGRKAYS